MAESLGTLLGERLKEMGSSPAELARLLTSAGHDATRQVVHHWLNGGVPRKDSLVVLWEVLCLNRQERRRWAEAAGYETLLRALDEVPEAVSP